MADAKIEQVDDTNTYTVTTVGKVRVTGDDVGRMFCALDAHAQAAALAMVVSVSEDWPNSGAEKQWHYLALAMHAPAAEVLRKILAFYDERKQP